MNEISGDILPPGVEITPLISIEESKVLLETLYGLKCKTIVELNSYDDKNYKITVDETCENKNINKICENGYVLKILNSFDSRKTEFVEAQIDMMLFLSKHNIKCSNPVLNKQGQYFSVETLQNKKHIVRLLEYIPGKIFSNVRPTKELFFNAGKYISNLDNILKNFNHPVYKTHKSLWMLNSVPEIKQFLYVIQNETDAYLIQEIINNFEDNVLRNISILEKGCLHGDFNEQNIIVKEENGIWKVDSIIDFGDTQYSCLLFELAVAATYMLIQGKDLNVLGYFLAGYYTNRPIPDHEYKLLKVCIAARFCQTLVMGIYSNLQNPENKYVLSTQTTGWALLRQLWSEPNDKLIENWKTAVEIYKNIHI